MFNKNLSRFQRRSLQLFSSSIIFTAFLTMMTRTWFKDYGPTGPIAWMLALIPSIPFIATVINAMRYLARETDEFIRTQVLLALLQGSLITLVCTVIYSLLQNFIKIPDAPAMAYIDIFLVASMIALRVHLRSAQ
jgi:hypothetical protein